MSNNRYPPPVVRKKVEPGRGVPLRQWKCQSFSAIDGRAASSIEPQGSRANHFDGAIQAAGGQFHAGGSWEAINKSRTQNPTPVKDRKLG